MSKKQLTLIKPDTAIDEIDDAAAHYVKVRDKRMALTKDEVEANTALLSVMKAHKKQQYTYRDGEETLVVSIKKGEEKAKVKRLGAKDDDDE